MSTGGEAADQMVRDGIQITEAAVKLSALGAKNLAAIALALAKDNPKVRGRTRLNRLLRDGKELKVFSIKASDLAEFKRQAKHYGVLFSAIKDRTSEGELIDILARAEDVSKLNRIFQRMGYAVPEKRLVERKKAQARRPSEKDSTTRGLGVPDAGQTFSEESRRPSVRAAIQNMKATAQQTAEPPQREAKETAEENKKLPVRPKPIQADERAHKTQAIPQAEKTVMEGDKRPSVRLGLQTMKAVSRQAATLPQRAAKEISDREV